MFNPPESGIDGIEVEMGWKGKSSATFTGASGQMAVMGELLHRKCNAAVPQVDVGTDVFAFRDDREDVARIQVKTALGDAYKDGMGYKAKFGISLAQLARTDVPPLFYALAVRLKNEWGDFLVISRARLQELWNDGCGSENRKSGKLELNVRFRLEKQAGDAPSLQAYCGNMDLSVYLNAWEILPPLKPLEEIAPAPHQT